MSGIQRHMVPGMKEPVSHFCHVVRAGNHVYVSGTVGVAADGSVPEDTVAQFDICLQSMDACLRHAGAGPEHVVKVLIFLTDLSDRARINPARQRYFGEHLPASTLVGTSGLVDPRLKVEIECVAYLPD